MSTGQKFFVGQVVELSEAGQKALRHSRVRRGQVVSVHLSRPLIQIRADGPKSPQSYHQDFWEPTGEVSCFDCGLLYGGPGWMDAVVEDDVWARISPTHDEGGILCITCMARRCEERKLTPTLWITSGPFVPATEQQSFQKGWDLGFKVAGETASAEAPLGGQP